MIWVAAAGYGRAEGEHRLVMRIDDLNLNALRGDGDRDLVGVGFQILIGIDRGVHFLRGGLKCGLLGLEVGLLHGAV